MGLNNKLFWTGFGTVVVGGILGILGLQYSGRSPQTFKDYPAVVRAYELGREISDSPRKLLNPSADPNAELTALAQLVGEHRELILKPEYEGGVREIKQKQDSAAYVAYAGMGLTGVGLLMAVATANKRRQ